MHIKSEITENNKQIFEAGKVKSYLSNTIKKGLTSTNLQDYESYYNIFDYDKSLNNEVTLFNDGTINVAYNMIDRHLNTYRKNKVAVYSIDKNHQLEKYTYQELHDYSCKIANMLLEYGIKKGDRVFIFLPRIIETYAITIALARIGAIAGPLFSAFGPDALRDRLQDSGAKMLITDSTLVERIKEIKNELNELESIMIINSSDYHLENKEYSFENAIANQKNTFTNCHLNLDDPLYMLYTSGTTGKPKGVVHTQKSHLCHVMTSKWVLDIKDEDIYWCTADPGWVTGMVYGIYGPLSLGSSSVSYEPPFKASSWYQVINDLKVNVWYTSPTALRMIMKEETNLINSYNLNSLRHILSVGEPLNPEVIRWGLENYSLPIHDTWWQTETGSMMITNIPSMPIKIGSMGRPLPGIIAAIVDEKGTELPAGHVGKLVLKPGWPSMLKTIWNNQEKFDEYFKIKDWYFSGDNAWMDEDGYFWFIGRADDVINTSGHRVGPFEVESALLEHHCVAEAAVIGLPDEERGEIIKAFVVLKTGVKKSEELIKDIQDYTKKHLAFHAYPRIIEIREKLPKTRSGKIMRRLLKAEDLGLPTGDISALEE